MNCPQITQIDADSSKSRRVAKAPDRSALICVICGQLLICCGTALLLLASVGESVFGCGGCFQLPYQSLLEKVDRWDRVVVARAVDAAGLKWDVAQVLKGDRLSVGDVLAVELQSTAAAPRLDGPQLLRWDEFNNFWALEGRADQDLVRFLASAVELSTRAGESSSVRLQAQRLRYFLPYLEHADRQIADSAHATLAKAPYVVLQALASDLDREHLLASIERQSAAINKRVALYVTLLGVRHDQRDAVRLQTWLEHADSGGDPAYLAAVLTGLIEFHGAETVRMIEQSYIHNCDRRLDEIVAAVDALRTHGEAQTTVSRDDVAAAFHRLLRQRPPLAELVVDDLARWEVWGAAPTLMAIYAAGEQPWNNALILKYLQACPLPSAKRFLEQEGELEKQVVQAAK